MISAWARGRVLRAQMSALGGKATSAGCNEMSAYGPKDIA